MANAGLFAGRDPVPLESVNVKAEINGFGAQVTVCWLSLIAHI